LTDLEPEELPKKRRRTTSPKRAATFVQTKERKTTPQKRKAKLTSGYTSTSFSLPLGWKIETRVRESGRTAGRTDHYWEAPDGTKLRSMRSVIRYLKGETVLEEKRTSRSPTKTLARSPTKTLAKSPTKTLASPTKTLASPTKTLTKRSPKPRRTKTSSNDTWEVEAIKDKSGSGKNAQYLVKWKGWPDESNSWEPLENLACKTLLAEYNAANKRKRVACEYYAGFELQDKLHKNHAYIPTITDLTHQFLKEGLCQLSQRLDKSQVSLCDTLVLDHYNKVINTIRSLDLQKNLDDGFVEFKLRHQGRYDMVIKELYNLDFIKKPPWEALVRALLGIDCILVYAGCMLSIPGSVVQPWHSDGEHLSESQHLPPHCLNIFIPLIDLTMQNGPTQFIPTSHINFDTKNSSVVITAKAGQCILFDYRLRHRGLANKSNKPRPLLYLTYAVPSFAQDENFSKERYKSLPPLLETRQHNRNRAESDNEKSAIEISEECSIEEREKEIWDEEDIVIEEEDNLDDQATEDLEERETDLIDQLFMGEIGMNVSNDDIEIEEAPEEYKDSDINTLNQVTGYQDDTHTPTNVQQITENQEPKQVPEMEVVVNMAPHNGDDEFVLLTSQKHVSETPISDKIEGNASAKSSKEIIELIVDEK